MKKSKTSRLLSSPKSLFEIEWQHQQTIPPEAEDLVQKTARNQHPTVQESVVEKLLASLKLQYLPRWVFRTTTETFIFDFLIEPNLVLECTLTARKGCSEAKAWLKDRSTIFERKFKELKKCKPQSFTVMFLEATNCHPEKLRTGIPPLKYTDRLITCLEEFEAFMTQWKHTQVKPKAERLSPQKTPITPHTSKNNHQKEVPLQMISKTGFRIRAQYYTPMAKPLGVNVPGSPTSTIPGSAPLTIETHSENPLAALANQITQETLGKLPIKTLRALLEGIQAISEGKVRKSGKKTELVQRILTSPHKELAVQRFLANNDVSDQCKLERLAVKLFTSLRGALRRTGTEILRELHLPYSMPSLPDDQLSEGTHRIGKCPDPEHECLVCRVFGSLNHDSIFRNYTPPLINDPDHKLDTSHELNHVFIRTHARNVHRPNGSTLNFNQQYFAGTFVTYLTFPTGLPDPLELGFLLNCIERCVDVGAAKAWGAGKLFIQSYTLEKVEISYEREWDGEAFQMTPKVTVTPLKTKLDQAFRIYTQWVAQQMVVPEVAKEGAAAT